MSPLPLTRKPGLQVKFRKSHKLLLARRYSPALGTTTTCVFLASCPMICSVCWAFVVIGLKKIILVQNLHALSRSLHPLDALKLRLAHLIASLHLIGRRYYFGRCVACMKVSMITNAHFRTFMWSTFKRMCNLSFLIKVTKPLAILGIRKLSVKILRYFITCPSF